MRITQNSMNRTQLEGLNGSLARLQRTQEQLTTGKRLVRPSDSPVDTVSAMRLRDQGRSLAALGENIKDGTARLQAADDALMRGRDMLTRVRTLVVAASNGVNGPEQRKAYSNEIEQLRQGMVQLANTQYAGQPVFGGTTTKPTAFNPQDGSFVGNNQPVWRKVTEAQGAAGDVNIAVSGQDIFADTGSATSILQQGDSTGAGAGLLDRIVRELNKPDTANPPSGAFDQKALSDMLGEIDTAAKQITEASSTIGARTNRLTSLDSQNAALADGATAALSKVEDTDFMKAAMDLNIQSNAYQAALNASAKIIQPTLSQFLR